MAKVERIFSYRKTGTINSYAPFPRRVRRKAYFKTIPQPDNLSSADILGIKKILNPNYKPWMKFIWLAISLSCICLCLYQITLRVTDYINSPIHLDIKIERQAVFNFPSVTLCSGALKQAIKQLVNSVECEKMNTSCLANVVRNASELLNEKDDTAEYWNITAMKAEDLKIGKPCPMFAADTEPCHDLKNVTELMKTEVLDTFWGRCLILTLKNKRMDFRGPLTWLSFNWNYNYEVDRTDDDYLFYFIHEEGLHHVHDAPFIINLIPVGNEYTIRVSAREYFALNTWNKPCIPEEEMLQCNNDCVEKLIEERLPCGLPFIKSERLGNCSTIGDSIAAFRVADEIYTSLKAESCNCKRPCHSMKYTVTVDDEDEIESNRTKLILMYADDTKETILEKSAFAQSALFSEIGGSLGLYLGISIFTILHLLEDLIHRVIIRFRQY